MAEPVLVVTTKPYAAQYSDPIEFGSGTALQVEREDPEYPGWLWCRAPSGKQGWVHHSFIDRNGNDATAVAAYTAQELTVAEGIRGRVIHSLDGWAYLELDSGQKGWLPETHLESCSA